MMRAEPRWWQWDGEKGSDRRNILKEMLAQCLY
jgi:hypothetical protein